MPLLHSSSPSAFRTNVKTLLGEVGKSPHVQSRSQALAIAYATKRRGRMDGGQIPGLQMGGIPSTPWQVRAEARQMHTGPILSAVAGRTDHHPMNVPAGAYVLPADHVSSMGQGNTVHGMAVLNKMFHGGPYGGAPMGMRRGMGPPRPPRLMGMRAAGGASDAGGARGSRGSIGKPVPINAAGGEFVIPPEVVAAIGSGNIKHGHQILDHWVVSNRKNHISTLKNLPGPAKS